MSIRKLIASESQEQKAIVKWLMYHPILKDFFCKNDNEGARKTVVKQGKVIPVGLFNAFEMGLRPGVSDLFIYYPSIHYHGLWLEIKRNKRYTKSEMSTNSWLAQEKFLETVKSVGFAGFFCYGFEDCKNVIENYLTS